MSEAACVEVTGTIRLFHRFSDAPVIESLADVRKEFYHVNETINLPLAEFPGLGGFMTSTRKRGVVGRRLIAPGDVISASPSKKLNLEPMSYLVLEEDHPKLAEILRSIEESVMPAEAGLYCIMLPKPFLTEVETWMQ